MPHPIMFDDDDPVLAQVRRIALGLPGATEVVAHGRPTFRCGKMFGNYGGGVKGGPAFEHALLFIPDPSEAEALIADPRFFTPAYYGPYGWLGLVLDGVSDRGNTDWTEVGELLDASYRQIAPKRRIAELDAR